MALEARGKPKARQGKNHKIPSRLPRVRGRLQETKSALEHLIELIQEKKMRRPANGGQAAEDKGHGG